MTNRSEFEKAHIGLLITKSVNANSIDENNLLQGRLEGLEVRLRARQNIILKMHAAIQYDTGYNRCLQAQAAVKLMIKKILQYQIDNQHKYEDLFIFINPVLDPDATSVRNLRDILELELKNTYLLCFQNWDEIDEYCHLPKCNVIIVSSMSGYTCEEFYEGSSYARSVVDDLFKRKENLFLIYLYCIN